MNVTTLLFIFDQYVISSDVVGYHEEFIPIITAIILMILRDQLMSTKTVILRYLKIFNLRKSILQFLNVIKDRRVRWLFKKPIELYTDKTNTDNTE